jgi:hypothetical protein
VVTNIPPRREAGARTREVRSCSICRHRAAPPAGPFSAKSRPSAGINRRQESIVAKNQSLPRRGVAGGVCVVAISPFAGESAGPPLRWGCRARVTGIAPDSAGPNNVRPLSAGAYAGRRGIYEAHMDDHWRS